MKNYVLLGAAICAMGFFTSCKGTYGFDDVQAPNADASVRNHPNKYALQNALPGVVLVKVAESSDVNLASFNPSNLSLMGASSDVTQAFAEMSAKRVERLFPPHPKFPNMEREFGLDRWYKVTFDESKDLEMVLNSLDGRQEFEVVEPELRIELPVAKRFALPQYESTEGIMLRELEERDEIGKYTDFNDPELHKQWHYHNRGQLKRSEVGADVNLFEAWKITTGKPNVIISVVDGEIDVKHEDLVDNLWKNPGEIPGDNKDNDGNGYIDDVHGFSFVRMTAELIGDNYGHGTHVAGTVAARNNNGIGVCGVAGGDGSPDSGVRLMSCGIFSMDGASGGNADAIRYGANHGAVISQNSWGFKYPNTTLPTHVKDAIDYFIRVAGCDDKGNQRPDSPMKGGVVFFAAGNDGLSYDAYPARYERVIAVTAMAPSWKAAGYTNYGLWTDIMAPGGYLYHGDDHGVYSTIIPDCEWPQSRPGKKYAPMHGTSMACPHVSGIAGLVVSKFGGQGFTNEDLKKRILGGLRPVSITEKNPNYPVGTLGSGFIDAVMCLSENKNMAPEEVKDLSVEPDYTEMTITWSGVADGDDETPLHYYLYSSEKPLDTEAELAKAQLRKIPAYGIKPGTQFKSTYTFLQDGKEYYYMMVAVDRWGLKSDPVYKTFSTKKNNAPEVTLSTEGPIKISKATPATFSVDMKDIDGHKFEVKISGESRGVSYVRSGDKLNFTLQAIAPVGTHSIKVTATDELGAITTLDIPFEVFLYKAPALEMAFGNIILGRDTKDLAIDLSEHFTVDKNFTTTFKVDLKDTGIATATVKDGKLIITPKANGTTRVAVSASDGISEPVGSSFELTVVNSKGDLVYSLSPSPVKDRLLLLVNPDMKHVDIDIRSVRGEQVYTKSMAVGPTGKVPLNLKRLTMGTYAIHVKGALGEYKGSFVKL